MRTPFELRKAYKEETGNPFQNVEFASKMVADDDEWNWLVIEEYIFWIESKYSDLLKEHDEYVRDHNEALREELDDALYEIGQLQYKIESAEDEINELRYQS